MRQDDKTKTTDARQVKAMLAKLMPYMSDKDFRSRLYTIFTYPKSGGLCIETDPVRIGDLMDALLQNRIDIYGVRVHDNERGHLSITIVNYKGEKIEY